MCGSRNKIFDMFTTALRANPNDFNMLLVDAEAPVTQPPSPWQHLARRDNWIRPDNISDDQCHLMVQCMEAWLIADVKALQAYYGQDFDGKTLDRVRDVEIVDKVQVAQYLERATKNTQKGTYHKINHGGELLAKVDPTFVRRASAHCDRLFVILESKAKK